MNLPNLKEQFTHLTDDSIFYEITEFQGTIEVRLVEIFNHSILSDCYLNEDHLRTLLRAIDDYELKKYVESPKQSVSEILKKFNFGLTDEEWEKCFGDDTK